MFTLVDCGSGQRYVIPAKSADESPVRLLLDDYNEESLTVYTDGFERTNHSKTTRTTSEKESFAEKVNTSMKTRIEHLRETHVAGATVALTPSRRLKDELMPYLEASQLRRRIFHKLG